MCALPYRTAEIQARNLRRLLEAAEGRAFRFEEEVRRLKRHRILALVAGVVVGFLVWGR
jgi:acid phosphatase family membrane protein YuiD